MLTISESGMSISAGNVEEETATMSGKGLSAISRQLSASRELTADS
jgi:hypothetical protein